MGVDIDRWVVECGCGQSCKQSEKIEPVLSKSLSRPVKIGEVMQLLWLIKSILYVKFLSEYMKFTPVFSSSL